MIGNRIFLDKSIETEITDIINEIITYIGRQYKCGTLPSMFYDDVLLLVSEILFYVENQDQWVDLGYKLCKDFKQNMESYGYRHQTAMHGGLGYRCFAVNRFCERANILQGFSRDMNQLLFIAINNRLKQVKNAPTFDENYDMIRGISGTLYYLLDCDYTQEEKSILVKCMEFLLSFTRDGKFDGRPIIRFHVLKPNQNPNFDQKDFKRGSINFGLAHGMLGPLIALSKAHARGFSIDGLEEGIEKLYHLYETYQVKNGTTGPYWPGTITVEEYWAGVCRSEHLHKSCSWCYGNIGILRGLQKVSAYMNWTKREQTYIEAMKQFFSQAVKDYDLFSPSLCHGFSSLVAVQTCAYFAYKDPKLLTNLERNVREIIKGYRKSNEKEVSLMDIQNEIIWVEGYLKDLSLLTGSVGIAITLLSLQRSVETGKLLMID